MSNGCCSKMDKFRDANSKVFLALLLDRNSTLHFQNGIVLSTCIVEHFIWSLELLPD